MPILSVLAMEKLLHDAGAPRVSKEAAEELRLELEAYAEKLCKKSVELCEHAGRRTILASDVKLAKR